MKKIFIASSLWLLVSMSSCLKDNPAVDFTTVGTIIEILPPNGGGLENFDAAELDFDHASTSDSADIDLNIASPNTLPAPLTITVGVNDALRTEYNSANGTDYEAMPDSVYLIPVSKTTIPAGSRLDTIRVYFNPSKIDPSKNYMLPVSITDAQGQTISGNFGSVYFHSNAD